MAKRKAPKRKKPAAGWGGGRSSKSQPVGVRLKNEIVAGIRTLAKKRRTTISGTHAAALEAYLDEHLPGWNTPPDAAAVFD